MKLFKFPIPYIKNKNNYLHCDSRLICLANTLSYHSTGINRPVPSICRYYTHIFLKVKCFFTQLAHTHCAYCTKSIRLSSPYFCIRKNIEAGDQELWVLQYNQFHIFCFLLISKIEFYSSNLPNFLVFKKI